MGIATAKKALLSLPPVNSAWTAYRARQVESEFEKRRDHYASVASARGYRYNLIETVAEIRRRIADRGWETQRRAMGEVNTMTFVPLRSEHRQLLTDLHEFGSVANFDSQALGFDVKEFLRADSRGLARRREMNEMFAEAVIRAHAERPLDWVFVYANGLEISARAIDRITSEVGVPVVNLCMDDKHSWTGVWMGDHPAGQIGIARSFDLSVTTSSVALTWYGMEGGRAVYMPEGYDACAFHPLDVEKDIDVSFFGAAYGFRPSLIAYLRKNGIPVQTFGRGWPDSGWVERPVELFNRSKLNLGSGGIGYSERLTTVKGRDFDIPGCGGGAYLTSYNSDLAGHYVIGQEILCYESRTDLLSKIRSCLENPELLPVLSRNAHHRCLTEHRWLHRYRDMLQILGVIE